MHDNFHSPMRAFLYFLFNFRGEPGIFLTAPAALSVQPCLTKFMDSAGSWVHPKAVSKGWGGLLVKSEKRGIGSCMNESVMMLLLLILDTQLPSSFFSILLESLPVLAFWICCIIPVPLSCHGPMCSFSGRSLVLSRVWREGREDRED